MTSSAKRSAGVSACACPRSGRGVVEPTDQLLRARVRETRSRRCAARAARSVVGHRAPWRLRWAAMRRTLAAKSTVLSAAPSTSIWWTPERVVSSSRSVPSTRSSSPSRGAGMNRLVSLLVVASRAARPRPRRTASGRRRRARIRTAAVELVSAADAGGRRPGRAGAAARVVAAARDVAVEVDLRRLGRAGTSVGPAGRGSPGRS